MTPPAPGRAVRPAGLHTEQAPPLDLPFRFLATAVGWLVVLAITYPWLVPLLLGSFYSPRLTAFVHLHTLGVIAATVLGASYQLVPVVLQEPIASVRLARFSWWLYLPGLLAFVVGLATGTLPLLATGGALLYAAVALYVGIMVATLRRARERDAVFWHVAAAVVGLATAASLGLLLALSKSVGFLGSATLPILGAHVALMLGGWVTPMLTGVAYRLVGMFTLSEDRLREDWARAELALTAGGAWILAAGVLFGAARTVGALGAALLLAGLLLYCAQLLRLYRLRRRRTFDVHIPFALASSTFGLLAVLAVLAGLVLDRPLDDRIWIVAGWWGIAGWAITGIQGFLYKIGTFLTWLHRFAPLVGSRPVPRLEELYGRRVALVGWGAWSLGVALVGSAAFLGQLPLAYVAATSLSVGLVAFLSNAFRVGARWWTGPAADATAESASQRAARVSTR